MTGEQALEVLDPAVGLTLLCLGGLGQRWRRDSRVGALMAAAGAAWFVGSLFAPAQFWHRGPLVQMHLSYPTGRLRRPLASVAAAAAYLASVLEGWAREPWLTVALSALVCGAAVDTFARTSGPARKAGRPALVAALAFGGVLSISGANQLLQWEADVPLAIGYDAVVAIVATVLLVDLRAGGWADATVTDLVLELGDRAGVTGLRRQLRQALGDPGLDIGYWVPVRKAYVDDEGTVLDPDDDPAKRTVTRIDDATGPVAVLMHDPLVLDDPTLLASVASVAGLAVSNARLQSEVEARVDELVAVRRRLVEAADVEKRKLVAALGAGAERHIRQVEQIVSDLVSDPAASEDDHELAAASMLAQVRVEVRRALVDVYALAQGIRPSDLAAGGLSTALPALAARAALPVTVTTIDRRLPPVVEAAAYFVCAEAVANIGKHARATRAEIDAETTESGIVIIISDDGVGGADPSGAGLRGLGDRVQALGGDLSVEDLSPSGTRVRAWIPVSSNDAQEEDRP
jgi:hypothetical protein